MITLATLEQATAQEVFDQVAKHMLTQKAQCALEDGVCAYRGNDGLKCAAGCLISDEEIETYWNVLPWISLINRGIAPDKHRRLISELQAIHDSPYFNPKEDWQRELRNIAGRHELSYAVVNETYG
jgi:hypothetical protein